MFRKKNRSKRRTRAMLSAYSIIMIMIILLGILSHVLPKAKYAPIPVDYTEGLVEEEVAEEAPVGALRRNALDEQGLPGRSLDAEVLQP